MFTNILKREKQCHQQPHHFLKSRQNGFRKTPLGHLWEFWAGGSAQGGSPKHSSFDWPQRPDSTCRRLPRAQALPSGPPNAACVLCVELGRPAAPPVPPLTCESSPSSLGLLLLPCSSVCFRMPLAILRPYLRTASLESSCRSSSASSSGAASGGTAR